MWNPWLVDQEWAFQSYLPVSAEFVSSELHWTDFFTLKQVSSPGFDLFVKTGLRLGYGSV